MPVMSASAPIDNLQPNVRGQAQGGFDDGRLGLLALLHGPASGGTGAGARGAEESDLAGMRANKTNVRSILQHF
jgi:hypothetical protein